MAWKPGANAPLGISASISTPDTVAQVAIGTVAAFIEDTQGPGDLIYLPGVAALAAGDLVTYDLTPGAQATTRHLKDAFPNSGRSVAVALAPVLAGQFGWFQIGGCAIVNAAAGTVAGSVFSTAVAGVVANTADPGDQILGARILTAVGTPAATKSYAQVSRPCIQSQIT